MAINIGDVLCDYLHDDQYSEPQQQLDTWRVAGTDGIGVQKQGIDAGRFSFRAVKFGTGAELTAWEAEIAALSGTVVTAVADRNESYSNLLIESYSPSGWKPALIPGGNAARMRSELTIQGRAMWFPET